MTTIDDFVDRRYGVAMTQQPPRTTARNAAANEVRIRRSQDRAAEKLTAAGWLCFPPDKAEALRKVIASYDELTGWRA